MKKLHRHQDKRSVSLSEQTPQLLLKKSTLSTIGDVIKAGKESNILAATTELVEFNIILKLFYINEACSRHRSNNFSQDDRFSSRVKASSTKTISEAWAQKEARNLMRFSFEPFFFKVPRIVTFKNNAVIMERIGDSNMDLAPTLSLYRKNEDISNIYRMVILAYLEMIQRANLIHGDFSGENILVYNSTIYLIDFSQSVRTSAKNIFLFKRTEKELIIRDLNNINLFFEKDLSSCEKGEMVSTSFIIFNMLSVEFDKKNVGEWKNQIEIKFTEGKKENLTVEEDELLVKRYLNSIESLQEIDDEDVLDEEKKTNVEFLT